MNAVQETDVTEQPAEEKFKELCEGCSGSIIGMHHREFYAAARACNKYLGRDVLSEQRIVEFEALPQEEKDEMKRKRNYGKYGIFHLMLGSDVYLALALAAHETLPQKKYLDRHRDSLAKPENIASISARFPEMTPERIERILAL